MQTFMLAAMADPADELGVSSLHMTFNQEAEAGEMARLGYLHRTGIQYHWCPSLNPELLNLIAQLVMSHTIVPVAAFLVLSGVSDVVNLQKPTSNCVAGRTRATAALRTFWQP